MASYAAKINEILHPKKRHSSRVLDLFAGCGGLALGFEAQGFETIGFEADPDCCVTYSRNLKGECHEAYLTPDFDYPNADIIIGGPPCQPFSVGGKQFGLKDSRDGFPAFISAVKKVQPELWIFENVRGMLYKNKWYLEEVIKELRALDYDVEFKLVNVVNFGVPQNRERVIVVGHRGKFTFPAENTARVTAGEALEDWAFSIPEGAKFLTPSMDKYIAKYEKASSCINPRDLHLSKPARTLTCRNLAGATGDMQRIKLPDGRRRRLSVKEAARLQSFPDWYEFHGTETRQYYQVGNAVPPFFSYQLAQSVAGYLEVGKYQDRNSSDLQVVDSGQPHLFRFAV